jgi:tetratricopeptide (TPR) repeat protein
MKSEEAFALVRQHGGMPRRGVTKQTGVLVVGRLGWPLLPNGSPSKSLSLARAYNVPIVSERQFLEWAGKADADEEVKSYTAIQISSLGGLPLDVVELLTAFGLLNRRDGHYGFRDVMAARQLKVLFDSGVALSTITRSLNDVKKWLPDAALSNLRLYPASSDRLLVDHLQGRTNTAGQFVLPVADPAESPDALFEQAQAAEEAGDLDGAERLYRKVMRIDPKDPTAAFNLGNLLRATGKKVEAEAAYRAATKADSRFAEAWYNLADILDDEGKPDKAAESLHHALDIDPNYADAVFNLAMIHQRREELQNAAICWRRYLTLDNESEWATQARRALKYCELKTARSA